MPCFLGQLANRASESRLICFGVCVLSVAWCLSRWISVVLYKGGDGLWPEALRETDVCCAGCCIRAPRLAVIRTAWLTIDVCFLSRMRTYATNFACVLPFLLVFSCCVAQLYHTQQQQHQAVRHTFIDGTMDVACSVFALNVLGCHPLSRAVYDVVIIGMITELHAG